MSMKSWFDRLRPAPAGPPRKPRRPLETPPLRAAWPAGVPAYVAEHGRWSYVHPDAVALWDRAWLVDLARFGHFAQLRDAALDALGARLRGRTLQVGAVYGDFTPRLAGRLGRGASLDVVDVLPVQLANLRRKLEPSAQWVLHLGDANALGFDDATFDQAVLFFLLHEQPPGVRERTLAEAVRVVRPGGTLVVVDYHAPAPWHPLHLALLKPILRRLKPFSPALWAQEIAAWLPPGYRPRRLVQRTFFGGLYQRVVVTV